MEEYNFVPYDVGPSNDLERRRRKRKKVRLWLGQPKRFDLVKKGVKVRSRKKKFLETETYPNRNQSIPAGMCNTEEAMAAAILLQMSSQGGNSDITDQHEEPLLGRANEDRQFTRPKGPSWIIDHDYAVQPHKYNSHRQDSSKKRSGVTKSRKMMSSSNFDRHSCSESFTDMNVIEGSSFSEQASEVGTCKDTFDHETYSKAQLSKAENLWYHENQLNATVESSTILHLDDKGEILRVSQSDDADMTISETDVSSMLHDIKGDVEYRTVVITENDEDTIQDWTDNVSYENCSPSNFKTGLDTEQLCRRCQQQLDSSCSEDSDKKPRTSFSDQPTSYNERPGNAPDVIPASVEGGKLHESRLSEGGHQSVREITSLSEGLVRNLENANMLESFMVLFRTIAAGHVPDLTECNDLQSFKTGINRLPVGITSNG